jgi:dTDP-4-amino-4,6-dideoxygalactose transaminase
MGMPQGSEVVIPDFCFIAPAVACRLAGLVPVLVDVDDDTLLDWRLLGRSDVFFPEDAKPGQGSRVRGIIPVHTYGRCCDMGHILSVARHFDLVVIEDLAEAHGVRPNPASDAACWSFNRTKIVHAEEAGACWFQRREDADRARVLRNQGHEDGDDTWLHLPRGCNYRMPNSTAVGVLGSLRMFDINLSIRMRAEVDLAERCPAEWLLPRRMSPWVYDFQVPGMTSQQQDAVLAALRSAGVPCRRAFRPVHQQPEFASYRLVGGEVAERAFREVVCLNLPVTEQQAEAAFAAVRRALA